MGVGEPAIEVSAWISWDSSYRHTTCSNNFSHSRLPFRVQALLHFAAQCPDRFQQRGGESVHVPRTPLGVVRVLAESLVPLPHQVGDYSLHCLVVSSFN